MKLKRNNLALPLRIERNNETWPPMKELRDFCSAALPVTGASDAHTDKLSKTAARGMPAEPAPSLNYQAARWFLNEEASLTILLLESPQSSLGKI